MENHSLKVAGYNPGWLSRPSPGFDVFASPNKGNTFSAPESSVIPGARRTIARRGTEIFVAIGKELRWADLKSLQDDWQEAEELNRSSRQSSGRSRSRITSGKNGYRTLKIPVHEDIRQLVISENQTLMAILTTHSVHVAVLPNVSLLQSNDTAPVKLRTHAIGPTAHLPSLSPVVSALWHPLGVLRNCLITVTADAVVRLWELQPENRSTYESPTLAVDLKKLADGTSAAEDFSASTPGTNAAFSPDSFEMEVASACFGGLGSSEENGWAAMTLWIAMREGDVYALCPLLPSKWQPSPELISSLTISSVTNYAAVQDDPTIREDIKRNYSYQMEWMKNIDEQEPTVLDTPDGNIVEVYTRPDFPSPVPQLQGPFEFQGDKEELREDVYLVSDIYAIAARSESDDDLDIYELNENHHDKSVFSMTIIFLLANTGRIKICLDVEGVSARWLPAKKSKKSQLFLDLEPSSLLIFEYVDTMEKATLPSVSDLTWPVISRDPWSRSSFFVTHNFGVVYVSAKPWLHALEEELELSSEAGQVFRLEVLANANPTICSRVMAFPQDTSDDDPPAGAVVSLEPHLGYMLLSALPDQPSAVFFEDPTAQISSPSSPRSPTMTTKSPTPFAPTPAPPSASTPRPAYAPGRAFYSGSPLPSLFASYASKQRASALRQEVRLSSATLEVLTGAHRALSAHTLAISRAAAEVFRRCERLSDEFSSQIVKTREMADKIDAIVDKADGEEDGSRGGDANERMEARLRRVKERQDEVEQRLSELRLKARRTTKGVPLSRRELKWKSEIEEMASGVMVAPEKSTEEKVRTSNNRSQVWFRFPEAQNLFHELQRQVEDITELAKATEESSASPSVASKSQDPQTPPPKSRNGTPSRDVLNGRSMVRIPAEIRKAKVDQVMAMLERESALVEATKNRLERLSMA